VTIDIFMFFDVFAGVEPRSPEATGNHAEKRRKDSVFPANVQKSFHRYCAIEEKTLSLQR